MASSLLLATLGCVLVAAAAALEENDASGIVRPCKAGDLKCLSKFFTGHSSCTLPVLTSPPLDPYKLDHYSFETPYFNVTEDRYNITITGLSTGTFKDFFYNTKSKRAVLVINLRTLTTASAAVLHYRLTGTEGIDILHDNVVTFRNLSITTVFSDYNKLSLVNSYSFPDIPNWPTIVNGKRLGEAARRDPRVARLTAAYIQLPMVSVMEAFKYRAPFLAQYYSSYRICRNL